MFEDDEAKPVAFGDFDGFGEAYAIDPEGQRGFDGINEQNGGNLHAVHRRPQRRGRDWKKGHGRRAREFAKIADQMRLIEIAGFGRDLGPRGFASSYGDPVSAAEAQNAAEAVRRKSALFEAAAAKLALAQIGLARDVFEIEIARGAGQCLDRALHRVWLIGGRLKQFPARQARRRDGAVGEFRRAYAKERTRHTWMETNAGERSGGLVESLRDGHRAYRLHEAFLFARAGRINQIEAAVG